MGKAVREQIKYHLNQGLTRRMLFDEMARQYACDTSCDRPHDMVAVEAEFQAMVADDTLTVGRLHGSDDFVVVTDWMPNSAREIRDAGKPIEDSVWEDLDDQQDPADLGDALAELGVLPEDMEAWIVSHSTDFGDSDVVRVEEVTLGPVRVGEVGMSYGRKPQDP